MIILLKNKFASNQKYLWKIMENMPQNNSQIMEELLKELTEREAGIIKYRYGITDGKAHTLEQTGEKFNLTRERIRQIEKSVLKQLSVYAHEHEDDFRP